MARIFLDMPERIRRLPLDQRGFPIPKFVEWIDGAPDFRLMSTEHFAACMHHRRCWICGEPLGVNMAFVIGPMCGINRLSPEPPSHRDCARFAARNCPFLSQPMARRRERNMPEHRVVAGTMIERNPGVCAVWVTKGYRTFKPDGGGVLFLIGDPVAVEWYAQGRAATRAQIDRSVVTGYPLLEAEAARQGGRAMAVLSQSRRDFERLLDRNMVAA